MEHMAWKGRIKPGCKEEYKRRHDAIWPEMVELRELQDTDFTIMSPISYFGRRRCGADGGLRRGQLSGKPRRRPHRAGHRHLHAAGIVAQLSRQKSKIFIMN